MLEAVHRSPHGVGGSYSTTRRFTVGTRRVALDITESLQTVSIETSSGARRYLLCGVLLDHWIPGFKLLSGTDHMSILASLADLDSKVVVVGKCRNRYIEPRLVYLVEIPRLHCQLAANRDAYYSRRPFAYHGQVLIHEQKLFEEVRKPASYVTNDPK